MYVEKKIQSKAIFQCRPFSVNPYSCDQYKTKWDVPSICLYILSSEQILYKIFLLKLLCMIFDFRTLLHISIEDNFKEGGMILFIILNPGQIE